MTRGVDMVLPTSAFPDNLAARGLLTPTPTVLPSGTIRVYVGMRGEDGKSRLGWADLDPETGEPWAVSREPLAPLGAPGAFDANGMILGDIFTDPVTGATAIAYIGFSDFPSVKFRAYSGMLLSRDDGRTFSRCGLTPWLGPSGSFVGASVLAVHSVRYQLGEWHALVAVGWDWEWIGSELYPKYQIHEASGPDLLKLSIESSPILDASEFGLYRLGRPRFEVIDGAPRIVATGGMRNGDYRAYELRKNDRNAWGLTGAQPYPVDIAPGCSPYATTQAAYPALLKLPSGLQWLFFCGDSMGAQGILAASWLGN